jgi:hypothetical protein
MGMQIVDAAGGDSVSWTGLGSITTSFFSRGYLFINAYSVTNDSVVYRTNNNAASRCGSIGFRTAANQGVVRVLNAAAGQAAVGTISPPLGNWFRLEFRILASTTVGEAEWRMYAPDDTTLLESASAGALVLAANVDQIQWGLASTVPATPFTIGFKDVAVSSSGWIGPSGKPGSPMFFGPQQTNTNPFGGGTPTQVFQH